MIETDFPIRKGIMNKYDVLPDDVMGHIYTFTDEYYQDKIRESGEHPVHDYFFNKDEICVTYSSLSVPLEKLSTERSMCKILDSLNLDTYTSISEHYLFIHHNSNSGTIYYCTRCYINKGVLTPILIRSGKSLKYKAFPFFRKGKGYPILCMFCLKGPHIPFT